MTSDMILTLNDWLNNCGCFSILLYVTRFAKTGHNSAFTEIHFIAPSRFGH